MGLSKDSLGAATKAAGAATKAAGAVTKAAGSVNKASEAVGNVRPVVKRVMKDKQVRKALAESLTASRRVYGKVGSDPKAAARTALNDADVQRDIALAIAALRIAATRVTDLAERRRRSRAWLWLSGAALAAAAAVPFITKRFRSEEQEYEPVEEPVTTP
jgi:hypothetical protein